MDERDPVAGERTSSPLPPLLPSAVCCSSVRSVPERSIFSDNVMRADYGLPATRGDRRRVRCCLRMA